MLSLGLIAVLAFQANAASSRAVPQGGPRPSVEAVAADTGALRHANHRTPPLAYATRISPPSGSIHIDGKLDEAVWSQAHPVTEFHQTAPHEGEPATERSDVRIAFDEDAIYVGARLL